MISLSNISSPVLFLCVMVYFALASIQTLHVFALGARTVNKTFTLNLVYEISLIVHFVAMDSLALAPLLTPTNYFMEFGFLHIPIDFLLWLNIICALLSIILFYSEQRFAHLLEFAIFISTTPIFGYLLDTFWVYAILADIGYFLFRTAYERFKDRNAGRNVLLRVSVTEALDQLPEGILYIGENGQALFMNEVMRSCLVALDLPTDLADARTIWPTLEQHRFRYMDSGTKVIQQYANLSSREGIVIAFPDETVRYFTRSPMVLWDKQNECIMAYDISEDDRIHRSMIVANADLERTRTELNESVENVQILADNDAILRMRANVHDVIGQRVSILHRYMEDGDISDDTLKKIEPLLTGMLDELAQDSDIESSTTLDSVVSAFSIIGIQYEIHGELPEDKRLSNLFVQIIRECSTNAVRHGQATEIYIHMWSSETGLHLNVSNNGNVPEQLPTEGSGTRGMRAALANFSGSLRVETDSLFTIQVVVPTNMQAKEAK